MCCVTPERDSSLSEPWSARLQAGAPLCLLGILSGGNRRVAQTPGGGGASALGVNFRSHPGQVSGDVRWYHVGGISALFALAPSVWFSE